MIQNEHCLLKVIVTALFGRLSCTFRENISDYFFLSRHLYVIKELIDLNKRSKTFCATDTKAQVQFR